MKKIKLLGTREKKWDCEVSPNDFSSRKKKNKSKKQMTNKQSILLTLNVSFEKSSF